MKQAALIILGVLGTISFIVLIVTLLILRAAPARIDMPFTLLTRFQVSDDTRFKRMFEDKFKDDNRLTVMKKTNAIILDSAIPIEICDKVFIGQGFFGPFFSMTAKAEGLKPMKLFGKLVTRRCKEDLAFYEVSASKVLHFLFKDSYVPYSGYRAVSRKDKTVVSGWLDFKLVSETFFDLTDSRYPPEQFYYLAFQHIFDLLILDGDGLARNFVFVGDSYQFPLRIDRGLSTVDPHNSRPSFHHQSLKFILNTEIDCTHDPVVGPKVKEMIAGLEDGLAYLQQFSDILAHRKELAPNALGSTNKDNLDYAWELSQSFRTLSDNLPAILISLRTSFEDGDNVGLKKAVDSLWQVIPNFGHSIL